MKAKEFIRKLKKHGVEIEPKRGKGGHILARFEGKKTTIPIHGSKDVDPTFLKKICKQLGVSTKAIGLTTLIAFLGGCVCLLTQ